MKEKSLDEQIKEAHERSKSKSGWKEIDPKDFDHYLMLLKKKDEEYRMRGV